MKIWKNLKFLLKKLNNSEKFKKNWEKFEKRENFEKKFENKIKIEEKIGKC